MSDQELKPCPFCGGEARRRGDEYSEAVICDICRASSGWQGNFDNARRIWNTRTPDPRLEELAGALEEIARCLSHGLQDCRASIIAKDMLGKYQQSKVQP